jgi:hypothetical protein
MKTLVKLMFLIALLPGAARMGFSRGDKIIPQVVDGPGWMTKFDLTNISPAQAITNMQLSFYKNDGSAWTLPTNQGTGSSFTLSIGPRQTLRIETLGGGTLGAGYAVIYDQEIGNSPYSGDYVLGISVFYVVSTPSGVVDTVTVSVPQVTAVATAPMQMNDAQGIYSGFSIVNWFGKANNITIDLYPENWTSGSPTTASFTLQAGEQRAEYLDQYLFPTLKTFKGMAEISADGPISFLGLLQTRASDFSPRYSTLVPVDRESLRRNSYVVLLQNIVSDTTTYFPLDIDGFTVDFYRSTEDPDDWSWDLLYDHTSGSVTERYLQPINGAGIATIGVRESAAFDSISLPDLKALSYGTGNLNLSNTSTNLTENYSFAVRTDLRNYAKARIIRIINTSWGGSTQYRDIVLEVVVYK